jgi:GlpG protein
LLLALQVIGIGLLSNVAQYFMGVSYFGGMSGVVYGLFGYVWVRSKLQPSSGYFMDRTNLILMIVWLFLCMTGAVGRVANTAHVSGLLIGMAWGFLASKINPK